MSRDIAKLHRQGDSNNPVINIVLFNPEIPQNTGTIGRLCVCINARLHLIKPLGFELDEKRIKRAGLDYWQYLNLSVHESWEDFLQSEKPPTINIITTHSERTIYDCEYKNGDYLVFGNEGHGLPSHFYELYKDSAYTIPMPGEYARSQNLSNSVSITAYEAIRQLRCW